MYMYILVLQWHKGIACAIYSTVIHKVFMRKYQHLFCYFAVINYFVF